ncbi:SSI family serine proteinase inhibitor [Streptomyces sp. NPDC050997]|uniref:SSI family serine proteinase inhibitor n=1 Tax=Streptomyces sp. NPDC050997 TaxID=3155519 RepID=UPI00342FAEEA
MSYVARRSRFAGFARLLVAVGSAGAAASVPMATALPAAAAPAVPFAPSTPFTPFTPGTPAAASIPLAPPPVRDEDRVEPVGDHLTVTVRKAGVSADGTYEVNCHPGRGSHPDVSGACAVVDRNTRWGKDVFGPVPGDSVCTMQYGGPATAHVTGTWAGRPVDATFDRSNGCEIGRWDRLVPLLPKLGSGS